MPADDGYFLTTARLRLRLWCEDDVALTRGVYELGFHSCAHSWREAGRGPNT